MLRCPRSRTRLSCPVFLVRWNCMSSLCTWSNVDRPTLRIASCATCANTAFRYSCSPDAAARDSPYPSSSMTGSSGEGDGAEAAAVTIVSTTSDDADADDAEMPAAAAPPPAAAVPAAGKASTTCLNRYGIWMFTAFPPSMSPSDPITRRFLWRCCAWRSASSSSCSVPSFSFLEEVDDVDGHR
jgi:hypothetical protein